MRAVVSEELMTLQQRQGALEAAAPAVRAQLAAARAQLRDVGQTSDAAYQELARIPEDERQIVDCVKMAVYEGLAGLRAENERLRVAASTDRDVARRMEEECAQARRAAALAETRACQRERDAQDEVDAANARLERVEGELREATVRAEVLAAKGSVYDELHDEHERLKDAHAKATVEIASLHRLRDEISATRSDSRDDRHKVELLVADKAHLERSCDLLTDQVRRMEKAAAAQEERVTALRRTRDELQAKLLEGAADSSASIEARFQKELARIRAESASEVERIRRDAETGYARELAVVRELRDAARTDLTRSEASREKLQAQMDELIARHTNVRKEADVREAKLLGRIEILLLERGQARAESDERNDRCKRLQDEADAAGERARAEKERGHALEHELARTKARHETATERLAEYERMEAEIDQSILNSGRLSAGGIVDLDDAAANIGSGPPAIVRALESAVPMAVRRRVKQALVLASRCSELEVKVTRLEAELESAGDRTREVEAELRVARANAYHAGRPRDIILDELERAEGRAAVAEKRAKLLASQLADSEHERVALRRDMKRLLEDDTTLLQVQSLFGGGRRHTSALRT